MSLRLRLRLNLGKPKGATYTANAVNVDGTGTTYLTTGAGMAGTVDSKLMTGSFWARRTAFGSGQRVLSVGNTRIQWNFGSPNTFTVNQTNSSGTTILTVNTVGTVTDSDWHHLMFSFDMSDAGKRHLYLDDTSDLSVVVYTNDLLEFTNSTWQVSRSTIASAAPYSGDLADLQFWDGVYTDLSQASNRARFISGGSPVNPSVAAAALGTQRILLSDPTATWQVNQGNGGGFTEVGTLTDGQIPVQL